MSKALFVGGPWHGRLVESEQFEDLTTWQVPVPVYAADVPDAGIIGTRTVIYQRRTLRMFRGPVSDPARPRAHLTLWIETEHWPADHPHLPTMVVHAMALALGLPMEVR